MYITTKIKSINEFEDSWFEDTYKILPQWRKEKCDAFKIENLRKVSILAGRMIYDAFLENGEDPDKVFFNENGKPLIESDSSFCFSLSHSKNAVAVSFLEIGGQYSSLPADNRIDATSVFSAASIPPRSDLKSSRGLSRPSVGVDIEYVREYDEKITNRFFTEEEQDYIKHSFDKNENFTRIWTSKEAYGKFTGNGINDGLKFSMFHDPLKPMNVVLPCFFEYAEKNVDGEKYLYTICYGVQEEEAEDDET